MLLWHPSCITLILLSASAQRVIWADIIFEDFEIVIVAANTAYSAGFANRYSPEDWFSKLPHLSFVLLTLHVYPKLARKMAANINCTLLPGELTCTFFFKDLLISQEVTAGLMMQNVANGRLILALLWVNWKPHKRGFQTTYKTRIASALATFLQPFSFNILTIWGDLSKTMFFFQWTSKAKSGWLEMSMVLSTHVWVYTNEEAYCLRLFILK